MKSKRILAMLLVLIMMIGTLPAFAAAPGDFADFPYGTWSEAAMTAAVNNGLLQGKDGGRIAPKDYLTRAEAATIINRAFGATITEDISKFTDVASGEWYYTEMAKAANMETIVGTSATTMNPSGYITRESMMTVLARALVISDSDTSSLSKFADGSSVSSWAAPYVAAMTRLGYVNGDDKGYVNPQANITREEFAQIMYNTIKTYITQTGTVNGVTYNTTLIRTPGVTLSNATINGDLIIGDGVGAGDINLTNVKVTGRILFRGGEGKVTLKNTTVGQNVIVHDVNGTVNFNNYETEAVFRNIRKDTPATFLKRVSTGGGGVSKKSYTVNVYLMKLDGTYPDTPDDTDTISAKSGATITYNTGKTGFTLDTAKGNLTGTNNGSLVINAYYSRNKCTVTYADGTVPAKTYDVYYGSQPLSKEAGKGGNADLIAMLEAAVADAFVNGYILTFNTKADGTGEEITADTIVGEDGLTIYPIKTPFAKLGFVLAESGDEKIVMNVTLDKMPYGIDKITSIEFDYTHLTAGQPSKLVWNKADSNIGGTLVAEDGKISWTGGEITSIADGGIVLFTITFTKNKDDKDDTVIFDFGTVSVKDGIIAATAISTVSAEITLSGKQKFTIKYNDVDYVAWYDATTNTGDSYGNAKAADGTKLSDVLSGYSVPGGYTNDGFKNEATGDKIDLDAIAKESITLVPNNTAITYTITYYDEKNGSVIAEADLPAGAKTSYTIETETFDLVDLPDTTTHEFDGWYDLSNDTLVTSITKGSTGNKAFYATWSKIDTTDYVTITFNGKPYKVVKGKELSTNAELKAALMASQDEVDPQTGYERYFEGHWISGDGQPQSEIVTIGAIARRDMTIEPKLGTITYYVGYYLDKADQNPVRVDEYTVVSGLTLFVPDDTATHTFGGWYDRNGNEIKDITPGTIGHMSLYAKWIDKTPSTLTFDYEIKTTVDNNVEVYVKLNKLPVGVDKLTSITLYYTENPLLADEYLKWIETTTTHGGNIEASRGAISWYDNDGITAQEIADANGILFTIVYTKAADVGGKVTFAFNVNLTELASGTTVVTGYETESKIVDLGTVSEYITLTFDGKTYTVKKGEKIGTAVIEGTTDTLADAMKAKAEEELKNGYAVTFTGTYNDGTKDVTIDVDADTAAEFDMTIAVQKTPIDYSITYELGGIGKLPDDAPTKYNVETETFALPELEDTEEYTFEGWYKLVGSERVPVTEVTEGTIGALTVYADWKAIEPTLFNVNFYEGTRTLKGTRQVESGDTLKEANIDVDTILPPEEYDIEYGYKSIDIDGNEKYNEIAPELWYQVDGEWELFDPATVKIVKDTDVHLLTRFATLYYETDIEIKGVKVPRIELSVAYDSNTDIIKSGLDMLTALGDRLDGILYDVETHGNVDIFQAALDKAAKTGLIDENGNLLNPNVPVPLHRLITEDLIMKEIDRYIDANINNEEFIADILRNDTVVDMLLNDQELKHNAMGDPDIRTIFLTDDFIKEIIRLHPEFVDIMIDHDEFIELIINNDATFDYVLKDETMVAKILDNEAFKNKIIDKGTDYIVDSYFGTDGDADIKEYITKQLKSPEVKKQLKDIIHNDADVKENLKETLRNDAEAKEIIKQEIEKMLDDDTKKDEIKQKIEDYLLANPDMVKDDVKNYIKSKKDEVDFKAKVKSYIESKKNDADFKAKVKSYIESMKDDADFKAKVKSYIESKKNDDDFKAKVKSYIESKKNDAGFKAKVKSFIESKKDETDFKAKVEDYIEDKKDEDDFKAKVEDYIEGKKDEDDFKAKVEDYIEGKKEEKDFKAKVEDYIEGKKTEGDFKNRIKSYVKDKAKTDKNAVLGNVSVKDAFLTEVKNVISSEGLTGTVTAEEVLTKYLNGSLADDYPEIAGQIDSAYEDSFENKYDIYFEDSYDSLFETYFESYFNENYDSLFDEFFEEYFESNYTTLFGDYFEEYFESNYTTLFGDYFEEYFESNYTTLFGDYFEEYFESNYTTLFGDYFEEYFESNYTTLFGDYFEEYFESNYTTLFNDHFSEYFDGLSEPEFDELVETHFDKFYENRFDSLFDDYFDDYFDTVFDALYESNVEKWARLAYDEPATQLTVISTIEDVISDLVDTYTGGTADQELKDFIDKIVEEFGVKEYVRDNYSTDAELKATIDELVKTNAVTIINDYAYERASEAIVKLIDENMHKYIEEIVDDYVSYELDADLTAFIDEEINIYMQKYIDDYISGKDRELLTKLVPTYAHEAVEAIKQTDAFKNTISDFASGNGVRVNNDNIMFIEILDNLMHTYDYDKLASDFLPENVQKLVDLVGHDMVAHIVNDYFAEFCRLMDEAIAKLNADLDAGIEDTEYKFSTTPAVRINYMDIVVDYYNKGMSKIVSKLNSKELISSNPYAQRLLEKNWIEELLDFDASMANNEMSGYSLKKGGFNDRCDSPIMTYYDIALENVILLHDAVMWYGTEYSEGTIEAKLDAASALIGTYANKANDVIMHYINTGELPKGYTPYEIADKILNKILGVNDKIDDAYDKVEDKYYENEDRILELIQKAKDFYEEKLNKDYTDIIDIANLSVYADDEAYPIYKILLEISEEDKAFNIDTAATAVFDSDNYHGINKLENAMSKVKSKLEQYKVKNLPTFAGRFMRDAYRATLDAREIKGHSTGTHTVEAQRYLK